MIGIDEVGRGSLAGPLLVVAARQTAVLPAGLSDSKLMSEKQRLKIFSLLSICCEFGEGWVSSVEIDRRGLSSALKLGAIRALRNLKANHFEEIIMDGPVDYVPKVFNSVSCIIRADQTIPVVSAAGIFAKVTRDHYMRQLKSEFPGYGFENHVGYGTSEHLAALSVLGPLRRVHRINFKPVRVLIEAAT